MAEINLLPLPTAEEEAIRKKARSFAENEIAPTIDEDDKLCRFRRSLFDSLTKDRLQAIITPKEYGGLGLTFRSYVACIEEIARKSLAMSVTTGVTNLPQGALIAYGSKEQKESLLRPLATGEWLGAFSLSEPGSGSDAAGLITSAKKTPEGYVLNGTKCWCSTAGDADLYLVMARTAPDRNRGISAFLVRPDMPGFKIGKLEDKMGIRSSPLGELLFDNCLVPQSHLLGAEGQGLEVALSQLDSGRIIIGAGSVGLAIEALTLATSYRQSQLKRDSNFNDGMGDVFADLYARLQAVRCLLTQVAEEKQAGRPVTAIASQIKLLASDLAMDLSSAAVTAVGMNDTTIKTTAERLFRDAKCLQIVEGTNPDSTNGVGSYVNEKLMTQTKRWSLPHLSLDFSTLVECVPPEVHKGLVGAITHANRSFKETVSSESIGFFRWPEQDHNKLLDQIRKSAIDLNQTGHGVLFIGIGGSFLGPAAIMEALEDPETRTPYHWISNIDPQAIASAERFVARQPTAAVVISKSGNTIETLAAFSHFAKRVDLSKTVVVTDPQSGELKRLSDEHQWQHFEVPPNIVGDLAFVFRWPVARRSNRYSVEGST